MRRPALREKAPRIAGTRHGRSAARTIEQHRQAGVDAVNVVGSDFHEGILPRKASRFETDR